MITSSGYVFYAFLNALNDIPKQVHSQLLVTPKKFVKNASLDFVVVCLSLLLFNYYKLVSPVHDEVSEIIFWKIT